MLTADRRRKREKRKAEAASCRNPMKQTLGFLFRYKIEDGGYSRI
jgi:hypothetical protein